MRVVRRESTISGYSRENDDLSTLILSMGSTVSVCFGGSENPLSHEACDPTVEKFLACCTTVREKFVERC